MGEHLSRLREARQGFTPGVASRRRWSDEVEAALRDLWVEALANQGVYGPISGVGLAAVGSLARKDTGPQSDLDLVLIHDGGAHPELSGGIEGLSNDLWYPIWDAHLELDHSVRSLKDCRGIAKTDLSASMSLLDLRGIAGDAELVDRAASTVLADWRAGARLRFNEIVQEQSERRAHFGRLAYLIEGDLKEAAGGLRDALLIKAVVASWLAERPSVNYDGAYEFLLDVRDALTSITGRHQNVLRLAYQDEVASILGFHGSGGTDPADELLAAISQAARTIRYAYSDVKRRALGRLESGSRRHGPRLVRGRTMPPRLNEVAPGVGELAGELVLTSAAVPNDAEVLFSLASEAAVRGLPIRLATLAHMYRAGAGRAISERWDVHTPWPESNRVDFERILRSGRNQISVWEALDTAGLLTEMIPPWTQIRNLPQRSAIHRHTVDRHQFEVASLIPDMASVGGQSLTALTPQRRTALLASAFFHDIGKRPGFPHHAERGAEMIPGVLGPMGYSERIQRDVTVLTRQHLLLGDLATSEDPSDPRTWRTLSDAVGGDAELLLCLHLLTQADASSCKPEAWGPWKASVVERLVSEAYGSLIRG